MASLRLFIFAIFLLGVVELINAAPGPDPMFYPYGGGYGSGSFESGEFYGGYGYMPYGMYPRMGMGYYPYGKK
uniref:Putative secreted protein n=1 Tax=Lutzomyia longipalpis TaxID=7200 RepID=A0A1B0CBU6_LUTLO